MQPRYLADEDLRHTIVLAVRRLEPPIAFATANEAGLSGSSDERILNFAFENKLVVVSHDVTTMRAAAYSRMQSGAGMAGLFLVPQKRPNLAVAESLVLIWSASQAEDWVGQIIYLPI